MDADLQCEMTGSVISPAPHNVISVTFLIMTYTLHSDSLKDKHGVVDSTSAAPHL